MAIKSSGNLFSDADIKKMISMSNEFLEVMRLYHDIYENKKLDKKNYEMKLRILISRELEYYKRRLTTWSYGIVKSNKIEIDKLIELYNESIKSLEVA